MRFKKNNEKRKRNSDIALVLVVLLLMLGIGYALLRTDLQINGTSKINNSTWNVHFNTPSVTTGSVPIDTTVYENAKAATKDDATTISYNVLLSEPGDFYEFTVEVENEGSIDAMIDTLTSTIQIGTGSVTTINSSSDLPEWLDYSVTYSDGMPIEAKHKLDAGDTENYKVRVEFKRDITNAQFNSAVGKELQLTFSANYKQKDSNATIPHIIPENAIYSYSTEEVNIGDPKNSISGYTTDYRTLNKTFFLKHVLDDNDVVIRNDVCFIKDNNVYCIKNRDDSTYNSDAINPYYEENTELLLSVFEEGYCSIESDMGMYNEVSCNFYNGYVSNSYSAQNLWNGVVNDKWDITEYCYTYIYDGSAFCE